MRALVVLVAVAVVAAGGIGFTAEVEQPADSAVDSSVTPSDPADPTDPTDPTDPAAVGGDGDDGVDDAAHFKYYQNDSDVSRWYEWWYLNVKAESGHRLLVEFFTFGDLNNPMASAVGVVMLFMDEDGSTYKSLKSYPGIPYTLSYETCDVSIAGDRFVRRDDGSYDVTYHNHLQQVDVDLHLEGCTVPISGRESRLNDLEWMSWNAAVPAGDVQGTVRFRDGGALHRYNMSGVGYHDHNWGISRKLPLQWDWGEFTDPSIPASFVYGAAKIGGGSYEHGGVHFVTDAREWILPISDVDVTYRRWEDVAGMSKPTVIDIDGVNGSFTVDATVRLHRFYLVAGTGWFGMPYLVGSLTADIHADGRHYELTGVVGFYEHHYFAPFG